MISIDTNVFVLLFTGDNQQEATTVKHLFEEGCMSINNTAIRENEPVL